MSLPSLILYLWMVKVVVCVAFWGDEHTMIIVIDYWTIWWDDCDICICTCAAEFFGLQKEEWDPAKIQIRTFGKLPYSLISANVYTL